MKVTWKLIALQGGSSSNPCSETYHGASAASEPEVQNTAGYFKYGEK